MPTAGNTITISYTDDILACANLSPSELADITRLAGAAKLFENGQLTLGQAAKLYGQTRVEFMETLVNHGFSCVNLTEDDAEDELRFGNGRRAHRHGWRACATFGHCETLLVTDNGTIEYTLTPNGQPARRHR